MKYDVVVVGAGPAGSTAAKVLAEQGIHVLLLDKETFPRDKPCGGGLALRVLKRFPYLEQHNLIDSYSSHACVHSASLRNTIEVQKNTPIFGMVLRNHFDTGLAELASRSGAAFLKGKKVVRLDHDAAQVRVTLDDDTTIDASSIVVADGIWSALAKQIHGSQQHRYIGMCVVEEYPVDGDVMDHLFGTQRCIHVHLNIFGIAGYGWVFPKKQHVNIGLCEFRHALTSLGEKKNLRTLYADYLKLLKKQKLIPKDLHIKNLKGGVFPTSPLPLTYGAKTVFCGDAAGLTNPLTGDGIYSAMVSGEIAANVLSESLTENRIDNQALAQYQRAWMHDFGYDYQRFFRLSKAWRTDAEKYIRIVGNDQKMIDLVVSFIIDPVSITTIRWKVVRRFIHLYMKDLFRR